MSRKSEISEWMRGVLDGVHPYAAILPEAIARAQRQAEKEARERRPSTGVLTTRRPPKTEEMRALLAEPPPTSVSDWPKRLDRLSTLCTKAMRPNWEQSPTMGNARAWTWSFAAPFFAEVTIDPFAPEQVRVVFNSTEGRAIACRDEGESDLHYWAILWTQFSLRLAKWESVFGGADE
jgi:hypothetical protein